MKMKLVLSSAAAMLALYAGSACAEAKNGFSLNGGLINSSATATMIATGTSVSYSGAGLSLGLDYQIAVSPNFSVNPFLMTSSESTSGALVQGTSAGHGILGIQLRYWADDVFFGAHVGRYTEALVNSNLPTTRASGNGAGLVVGWEDRNGGLYAMGQLDSAKVQYVDANVKLTEFRASVGYRWK